MAFPKLVSMATHYNSSHHIQPAPSSQQKPLDLLHSKLQSQMDQANFEINKKQMINHIKFDL